MNVIQIILCLNLVFITRIIRKKNLKQGSTDNFAKSILTRAHLEFDWGSIKLLLFSIILDNYNYIFHTIKICNKNYTYQQLI
jgi:hypothetical protein